MRPLPLQGLSGAPAGVLGISVIRGRPTPVVDFAMVMGGKARTTASSRYVALNAGERPLALLVDEVVGLRETESVRFESLPPLWQSSKPPAVAALGALDHELLVVLDASRLLPSDFFLSSAAGDRSE